MAAVASKVERGLKGRELWAALLDKAKEAVEHAAKEQVGRAAERPAVAEALAVEAAAAHKQEPANLDVVLSSAGIAHSVLFGPGEVDLDQMASVCGWRFGKARNAKLVKKSDMKADYKTMCARCFTEEREQAKAALASQAMALDA